MWDRDWERARLALKLRMDFRLSLAETAHVLNAANYSPQSQPGHCAASVQRLLTEHHLDLKAHMRSRVNTPALSEALGGSPS